MEVTGISVEKANEIKNASIVSAVITPTGQLVFTNGGGSQISAGDVGGIREATVDASGNLLITMLNGSVNNLGRVRYPPPLRQTFISSGTYAIPPLASNLLVELWGGGGAGGPGNASTMGGGGGGGGYIRRVLTVTDGKVGGLSSIPYQVPASSALNADGGNAVFSTPGSPSTYLIAYGGKKGVTGQGGKGGASRVHPTAMSSPSVDGEAPAGGSSMMGGGGGGAPNASGGGSLYGGGGGSGGNTSIPMSLGGFGMAYFNHSSGSNGVDGQGAGGGLSGPGGGYGDTGSGASPCGIAGGGGGGGQGGLGGTGAPGRVRITAYYQDVM